MLFLRYALAVSVCWRWCAMIILLPFKVLAFLVVAQRPCHQIRGSGVGGGSRSAEFSLCFVAGGTGVWVAYSIARLSTVLTGATK